MYTNIIEADATITAKCIATALPSSVVNGFINTTIDVGGVQSADVLFPGVYTTPRPMDSSCMPWAHSYSDIAIRQYAINRLAMRSGVFYGLLESITTLAAAPAMTIPVIPTHLTDSKAYRQPRI